MSKLSEEQRRTLNYLKFGFIILYTNVSLYNY